MLLSELKLNEKGRITKINLLGRIKAKFGELGVIEGADVILLRKTLLGGEYMPDAHRGSASGSLGTTRTVCDCSCR